MELMQASRDGPYASPEALGEGSPETPRPAGQAAPLAPPAEPPAWVKQPEASPRPPLVEKSTVRHWQSRLLSVVLPALTFVLVLWNALHLAVMIGRMPDNDFAKAYYSTAAFLHGGEMYGINPSTPSGFRGSTTLHLWNLNPPHFHILLLPLATLPPYPALAIWSLINAICLGISICWIVREVGLPEEHRPIALVGFLAFVGTNSALLSGHCSFLLLLLVTRAWLLARHGRWVRAGLFLGLGMSIKPFLVLLVPYLFLRRRWDALGAAVGMSVLCFALGLAVLGVENHRVWYAKLGDSPGWAWQFMNGSLYGLLSRTFTSNPVSTPLVIAPSAVVSLLWLGIGIPVGLATLAVAASDPTPAGADRAWSILLVGALVLSPLGWTYYFWLPVGPLAAVASTWWAARKQRGENTIAPSPPWSRRLLLVALAMLMWPLLVAGIFQPHPLSTILIGNLYSYGAITIWMALLIDGARAYRLRHSSLN